MNARKRRPASTEPGPELAPELGAMNRPDDHVTPTRAEFLRERVDPMGYAPGALPSACPEHSLSWTLHPRWRRIGVVPIVLVGMASGIGVVFSHHLANNEGSSRPQPPAPGYPAPTQTEKNNNLASRMGFVRDLDGMVIAYTKEANRLVSDGRFRIDLPLKPFAEILGVSPDLIAHTGAKDSVDPDAELFKAQAGVLGASGKKRSQELRARQMREGKTPDAALGEMVITNFSFTLNRLKQPNDEEKIVLSAIIRAAVEAMPMPGDKIRAVPLDRGELERDLVAVKPGMLPLELPEPVPQWP
jgi:hypothetical protein